MNQSPTDLPQKIQQLLQERQQHADALSRIDQVLAGVDAALGGTAVAARGRIPQANGSSPAARQPAAAKGKSRRKVGTFSRTGEESVLAFVKEHKNPTSQEIERHWTSEGRRGLAANSLTRLVKAKKLKRTPLGKGIRGSRYSLV